MLCFNYNLLKKEIMKTFAKKISDDIEDLKNLLEEYLLNFSDIIVVDPSHEDAVLFISLSGNNRWRSLNDEGKRIQSRIFSLYNQFTDLVDVLFSEEPKEVTKNFNENKQAILEFIEQNVGTWKTSSKEVFEEVVTILDNQIEILNHIYSSDEKTIVIPDTNALIKNPDLDMWKFNDIDKFEVVLLPTILQELDKLKNHFNKDLVGKVDGIIRRIKGYRDRGRLIDGVTLMKEVSTLRTLSHEPNFEKTLNWLDRQNEDDRILASVIDLTRKHVHSIIVLVTADINLQNKAESIGIPFLEPPQQDT